MNFTLGKTQVTVSFWLAVGLCAAALLPGRLLPLLLTAVTLHEGGHFAYLLLQKKHVGRMRFSLTGVRVTLADGARLSGGEELLLNLCGPAANLLTGGAVLICGRTMQVMRMAAVSFAVAAATLVPLGESDGTAIVDILLERYVSRLPEWGRKWLRRGIGAVLAAGLLAVCGAFG